MKRSKSAAGALRPAATRKQAISRGGQNKELLARLATAIRLARTLRGRSQRELAKEVGLSQNSIWLFEQARREPGILALLRIAHALNLPIEFFLVPISEPRAETPEPEQIRFKEARDTLAELASNLLGQMEVSDAASKKARSQRSRVSDR